MLPNFDGKVYLRSANFKPNATGAAVIDDYAVHAYQYATSSKAEFCQPAAIIYAENENDVKRAIQYALNAKVAIALRTGGHSYGGHSSTAGANIQLDMSNFKKLDYNSQSKTVTCGVGIELGKLIHFLGELEAFVPHGQCSNVHLGGHMQTGGFSVLCGRSHGWFCDYLTEFRIITADLNTRVIHKPIADQPNPENDDIWFAVLGGSPGSLGVITELTIRPLWDKDYPESRSSTFYMLYSKKKLEKVLQLLAEYNDQDDLPADFNIAAFVLDRYQFKLRKNIDTKIMKMHPEVYGGSVIPHPTIIGFWGTWCNLDGKEYSQEAKEFFAYIEERMKPCLSILDKIATKVAKIFFNKLMPILTPKKPTSMSKLTLAYSFPIRSHANPYGSGSNWCAQSTELATNGFAKMSAQATHEVHKYPGCYTDFEWIVCGGRYSRNRTNTATNSTALSWRDLSMFCLLYVHYDNTNYSGQAWSQPKEFVEQWIKTTKSAAIGDNGYLGKADQRWLAFPDEDDCLDRDYKHYFRSETVYKKVLEVKRNLDPRGIFSPHHFGVGATDHMPFPPK